jgi:hypothetical protein
MERLSKTHYEPDSPVLHIPDAEYDDAISDYSSSGESLRKPLQPFDTALENGGPLRPRRRNWWNMVVRARRRNEADESKEGVTEGLLADIYTKRRSSRRVRNWYNYCVFGGISGLSVMYGLPPNYTGAGLTIAPGEYY